MTLTQTTTAGGIVRGTAPDVRGVSAFLGIPYAEPPIGERRWRSPERAAPWEGVHDATDFAPSAPTGLPGPRSEDEDCLYVNVWSGAASEDERRPVLVWVPGGGFQESNPARPNVQGDLLAAQGAVVVSFTYRAGVLGFLAHPELDAEGTPSGNFGLQDQVQALRWVKENIAAFGGDPECVTIFGESAGAASVAFLMSAPSARGLFHRAIGQSCGFWESVHGSIPTAREARERGADFLSRLGVASVAEARFLPVSRLLEVGGWRPPVDPLTNSFSPSVDGWILPDSPPAIFAAGKQADVPLLAGWNGAEGATFAAFNHSFDDAAAIRAALEEWFGPQRAAEADRHYPTADGDAARASLLSLTSDTYVVQQTWEWMQLHAQTGSSTVHAYYFDVVSAYTPAPVHTAEIDYVFGGLGPHWLGVEAGEPSDRDREISDQMIAYWINFARNGDPNEPSLPAWPRYAPDLPERLEFSTSRTAVALEAEAERFRFLQSLRGPGHRRPEAWRSSLIAP